MKHKFKMLLGVIICSIPMGRILAQQYEIEINQAYLFKTITQLDEGDYYVLSDNHGNNIEGMVAVNPSATVGWKKHLRGTYPGSPGDVTSFGQGLPTFNHRVAYDKWNDIILIGGQSKDASVPTAGIPAYVILNGSGTLLHNRALGTSPNGYIIGTIPSENYGFFVVGGESELNTPVIARVDYSDSTNNWQKRRFGAASTYFDVAVDEEEEIVTAVGFEEDPISGGGSGERYLLVDFYDPANGNLLSTISFDIEEGGNHVDIQADAVESVGNGRFMVSGHSDNGAFLLMIHYSNATGQIYWAKSVNVDLIPQLCQMKDGNVAFLFNQGDDSNSDGVGKVNLNGGLEWANKYGREKIWDIVANNLGGLGILVEGDDVIRSILVSDFEGRTACYERYGLDIAYLELNKVTSLMDPDTTYEETPVNHVDMDTPTITASEEGCCWINYDALPGRVVWLCDDDIMQNASLDADPDGIGYSTFLWKKISGSPDTLADSTNQVYVGFHPSNEEQIYYVEVSDGTCEGWDRVRLRIFDPTGEPIKLDSTVYCTGTSAPVFQPIIHDFSVNNQCYSSYEDPTTAALTNNDLTNWNNLTSVGGGYVTHLIDEAALNPSCIIPVETPFKVISSCCSSSFTIGTWTDHFGEDIYGMVTSPVGQNLQIIKFRFSLAVGGISPINDTTLVLHEGEIPNQASGSINGYAYPTMPAKKLTGWSSSPLVLGTGHDLILEAWFVPNNSFPYTVCGYNKTYLSSVNVSARMKNDKEEDSPISLESGDELIVFPNPSTEGAIIDGIKRGAEIVMYDISNKIVYKSISTQDGQHFIPTSIYHSGTYILKVYQNQTFYTQKVLILRN